MMDVPYEGLLDPVNRHPFSSDLALPNVRGVYAWWAAGDSRGAAGSAAGPLYLAASNNIAEDVRVDAAGPRMTAFRDGLMQALPDMLEVRPRTGARVQALTKAENVLMSDWIQERLVLSWSELPHPRSYQRALVAALDPVLNRPRREPDAVRAALIADDSHGWPVNQV